MHKGIRKETIEEIRFCTDEISDVELTDRIKKAHQCYVEEVLKQLNLDEEQKIQVLNRLAELYEQSAA